MPCIANNTVQEFQRRVQRFNKSYVNDWKAWIAVTDNHRPAQFGAILRRWKACRPNRMRRTQAEQSHAAPYLEDLIAQSNSFLQALRNFDIRGRASLSSEMRESLEHLWELFQHLSYRGRARNGLAGVVGISKAVLLLTEGRVGPAFDSVVRGHLKIQEPRNAGQWVDALQIVTEDIQAFESLNCCTLQDAAPPEFTGLHSGRIYDMALGPQA